MTRQIIVVSVMFLALSLGCDLPPELYLELDTDTIDGQDDDQNDSDDTDGQTRCVFQCFTEPTCNEIKGSIHDEMACPGNTVCCETAIYNLMWTCIICEEEEYK